MTHELHAYDYVNHAYEDVRDALRADPLTIFQRATTSRNRGPGDAELRAHAGPLDVAAPIEIELGSIGETVTPAGKKTLTIGLVWKAAQRPGLFPTLWADLRIYPLTSTETQLELAGAYDPPLGMIGDAIDAMGLGSVAEQTVTGFIQAVAAYLRERFAVPAVRAS